MSDFQRAFLSGDSNPLTHAQRLHPSYFHYTGGFGTPMAKDISPGKGLFGGGDPMYVVYAEKMA